MKKYFLLFAIFTTFCYGQDDNFERVYIETGIVKPLGTMADKFEPSPSFGFWFRNQLVKKDYIDFGFQIFTPIKAKNILFKHSDSIISYKSKHFAINIGGRFAKVLPLSIHSSNLNFEWNSGVGLALNAYQAPKEIEFKDGDYSHELLTTFYLSQGFKLNYKNVGLYCHYQWSPYSMFNKKIAQNYGSQSLSFGVVYRQ